MNGVVANRVTLELIGVERLNVSSMVLVEVGQAVIEVDGRTNVVGDVKLERTDRSIFDAHTPGRSSCV